MNHKIKVDTPISKETLILLDQFIAPPITKSTIVNTPKKMAVNKSDHEIRCKALCDMKSS